MQNILHHYETLPVYNQKLIPLSNKKYVYTIESFPEIFVKVMKIDGKLSKDLIDNEIKLQRRGAKLKLAPKIIDYFWDESTAYILMDRIFGKSIYDLYGDNSKDVPTKVFNQIRDILEKLYSAGIEYSDISSYNFIIDNEKMYVIDFGHAKEIKINWFLRDFLDGCNEWNEDFA
jgi:serine/threonine protein kinase